MQKCCNRKKQYKKIYKESFVVIGKTHQEIEDKILERQDVHLTVYFCVGEELKSIKEIVVYFDDIR